MDHVRITYIFGVNYFKKDGYSINYENRGWIQIRIAIDSVIVDPYFWAKEGIKRLPV